MSATRAREAVTDAGKGFERSNGFGDGIDSWALTPEKLRKLGIDWTRDFVGRWDPAERKWFVSQAPLDNS